MLTEQTAANLDETMTVACMALKTAYEQGATDVHVYVLPDALKVVIEDCDVAAFTAQHPNIPLTEIPPFADHAEPMHAALFRYADFLPASASPASQNGTH